MEAWWEPRLPERVAEATMRRSEWRRLDEAGLLMEAVERGREIARFKFPLYHLASTFSGSAESGGAIPRRLTPIR
jgi:hypothetical protein